MESNLVIGLIAYSFVAIVFGVWLGHKLTMKAFSHVQPSTKDMAKAMQEGTVMTEIDPFDEAMKEPVPDLSKDEEARLKKEFDKTGLPDDVWNHYKRTGRSPADFFGFDTEYPPGGVEEELEKEEA